MHWEDFLAIDYLAILRAQGIQIKCSVLFSKGNIGGTCTALITLLLMHNEEMRIRIHMHRYT